MRNISLRGLDEELTFRLQQAAKEQGKSVNQVILDMLRRSFGLDKDKRFTKVYDDMDALFGKWSQEEFDRIQGSVDQVRSIDPELWQ